MSYKKIGLLKQRGSETGRGIERSIDRGVHVSFTPLWKATFQLLATAALHPPLLAPMSDQGLHLTTSKSKSRSVEKKDEKRRDKRNLHVLPTLFLPLPLLSPLTCLSCSLSPHFLTWHGKAE